MITETQTYCVPIPPYAVGPIFAKTAAAQAKKHAKRLGLSVSDGKVIDGHLVFILTKEEDRKK